MRMTRSSLDLVIYFGRSRRDFESEPGSIPVGTIVEARRHGPRVLPRRLLFYFCELDKPRVILLVFLLVSAAIDG
jgi:hypothetical protein